MYTNPSNLTKTLIGLLERNALRINKTVQVFEPNRSLMVLEGMRPTLPADAYPSLEIESTSASNSWAVTRAQRPRYEFTLTLTVKCSNMQYGHEYICTLATAVSEVATSPENLQLPVVNEVTWTPYGGLVQTVIMDSLIENVTYNATKDGSIRVAELSWFALINEAYPDSKWRMGESKSPSLTRPDVVPLL